MQDNEKPRMRYRNVAQKDPSDPTGSRQIFVPTIVDRNEVLPLSRVVRDAIKTGRIVGLQPSAARGIAEAICDEIYEKLAEGNSVSFGSYFRCALYLNGTVASAAAPLSDKNAVNIRVMPLSSWRLSRDTFSWSNALSDLSPTLDAVIGSTGVTRQLVRGGAVTLVGSGFGDSTEGVTVKFEAETLTSPVVGTVSDIGDNLLTVAWPSGLATLAEGTVVTCTVGRLADGVTYWSNCRTATILVAE